MIAQTPSTVSVLIPTLNFSSMTHDAVNSALSDTSVPAVEVCLVLDGEQPVTIPEWVSNDSRIRFACTNGRSGAAVAINLARELATAPYLARLDADDKSYRQRFGQQIAALDDEVIVVGAMADLLSSTGKVIGIFGKQESIDDPRLALLHNNPFVHSSILMRSRDFDAVGGYDSNCVRMQDYDLLLRLALRGSMKILPDRLVGYRIHEGQTNTVMHGFLPLMTHLGRRRVALAASLNKSVSLQHMQNVIFTVSQATRYAGLRKPGYLRGLKDSGRNAEQR